MATKQQRLLYRGVYYSVIISVACLLRVRVSTHWRQIERMNYEPSIMPVTRKLTAAIYINLTMKIVPRNCSRNCLLASNGVGTLWCGILVELLTSKSNKGNANGSLKLITITMYMYLPIYVSLTSFVSYGMGAFLYEIVLDVK